MRRTWGEEVSYRVRVEQDYDLSCANSQHTAGDMVTIHSDQLCIRCIDFVVGHTYLLMGTVSDSRKLYYSNGEQDKGWVLEAMPRTGGCVVSPWEPKYSSKICSWLSRLRNCGTRTCT